MKRAHDHQSVLKTLRQALEAAAETGQTIEEFANNFKASLVAGTASAASPMQQLKQQSVSRIDTELVVSKIQPNELLQGWRGRMAATNCLASADEVEAAFQPWCAKKSLAVGDDPDFAAYAAAVLGVNRQEVIQRHTLTPYFDALSKLKQNKPGRPGRHLRTYQRLAPLRIDRKVAVLCPQCVKEDLAFWGYSYWRRSHHLPGVVCCSTHAEPLLAMGGHNCFDRCPDHYLDGSRKQLDLPQDEPAKGILLRYARIAEEILGSSPTIDSVMASSLIGDRVKQAGLRITKGGIRKTLSTHLMELLPLVWLEETFPRIHWQRDKYISTIDGVCTPNTTRYTTSTLCMLAAVFYDDPDQAIAELLGSSSKTHEPFLGFDFWASREVFDLYCAHEGVVSQMAEALGLPVSTVSIGLLNQGLPGLGRRSSPVKIALQTFFAGQSIETSCRTSGVTRDALESLLRTGGARLSKALERMSRGNMAGRPPEYMTRRVAPGKAGARNRATETK